ncbi:class I SAM-dependent methyltransferase [Chelativorans salis]|uniref:Class I SAM-dependent methyltransferase n=1 Tax=Chelativorans salis TaxID=2978478 RepID=A0ABT2LU11_9HYPH|nr:class I SAM-dependent methyltransferase [Chelativorans sp. EGI FJ00035]MCT7376863.1 class I SAM-dependent methyltransferase [Chelativorans sp. EGI FJ00035]
MHIDRSEGWDGVARQFMAARSAIGATLVRSWARNNLPPSSSIVDVGCGSGVPIAQALIEDGFTVFGIDASPTMIDAFRRRLPEAQSACEAVQDSVFFQRTFDAAVSIGLLFLLSPKDQLEVLHGVAKALRPGGRFLFSAPRETCDWQDMLTGRRSRSLGEEVYERLLEASGLCLVGCHVDEEKNNYYDAAKPFI